MILDYILRALAVFVAVGTFLPLIRCDHWFIRGWDFPKIQLFALGAVVLIALSITLSNGADFWSLLILAALTLAMLSLGLRMGRYTLFYKNEVLPGSAETGIRIIVSNVLMTNRDSEKLLALVRQYQPDLFVTLEVDSWWDERISTLDDLFPYGVNVPFENTYGMILRSRIPLIDPQVDFIVRKDIPSIHADLKLADGSLVHLHAVHPKPPFPDEDTSSTDRDAELLVVGKRVEKHGGPTIVLGDLNDVAWSRTTRLFQKISGLLDPRVGRGFFSTFHAGHWFMRWPLDHVFISDHFRLRCLERLPNVGSDHFPMYVDFSFEPNGKHQQEAPDDDSGDRAEAEEKIDDAEEKNGHSIS
ncbi:MAG: endonuclease/exonuclease/phosphatase family protein [Luteolibacter sp.]